MDRLPTWCVIHLAPGSGRAELARAPGASGHRTLPGARLFTVGYQWLRLAIKFMKRGGVPGRRAGPRSFPTLIGISQALRTAVKDLGCPEPRLPLPARPPARRLAGCCPARRGSGGQGCGRAGRWEGRQGQRSWKGKLSCKEKGAGKTWTRGDRNVSPLKEWQILIPAFPFLHSFPVISPTFPCLCIWT